MIKNNGKLSENTKVVYKRVNEWYVGFVIDEYYNNEDRIVRELYNNTDGSPYQYVDYEYYETGEKHSAFTYDAAKENMPLFFRFYNKDGKEALYGQYNDGYFLYLIHMDDGKQSFTEEFYETGELSSLIEYYNEMTWKSTGYFKNGEKSSFFEFDDAGELIYKWQKDVYDDGSYRLTESKDGMEIFETFGTNGKKISMEKRNIKANGRLIYRLNYPWGNEDNFNCMEETKYIDGIYVKETFVDGILKYRDKYEADKYSEGCLIFSESF